ncbi:MULTISPECIES: FAD-dependent oxidoreductase [Streptomyces]|uniref:Salicylate hydroxylase n=2 Tax=Streptomyces TaxID=1883 RepID=A0ABT9KTQ2_9ACTN|nr:MULTISPECIES: FAD-dependent oxidoreductase [Streptomyces]MBW8092261.1 FAD-dependent monooxygenase [Streptomyces hygroscopicus subsp. hygroscopicus]MCO8304806.1 FAD-dependent oxidoreductase [Streptomyces sp. RKCA744]MDN3053711.1 FAD-dependent oxidoreductase [Streptomyces sp. SRF1]MDP9611818.1 salicylate hydroxylase [Streptomyces demainii]GHJ25979.1 hydroxylase [Streptomyces hygroscopicus]
MASTQSLDVVIVGGGLGGMTAALALRQRGHQVTVLEQAPRFGEIGAGIQTAPNASRVLLGLGLRRQLEAIRTEPQDQVRRRWKDGSVIGLTQLGDYCKQRYNAPYWHYHRADLHGVLTAACVDPAGPGPVVELHTSSRVSDLDRGNPRRPAAVTEDGRRFEADVLVGADGIRSRVRDLMGLPDTLLFSGEMAFRALIPGDLIAADPATRFLMDRFQSTIWYGPDRHLVHYMIRGGEYLNVVGCVPCTDEIAEKWTGSATADDLVNAYEGWDDRVAAMLSKAKDDVLSFALYHRRRDPVWVDGPLALLGDACHAMLPYQAQGASQAMEDAAVLAEELGRVNADGVEGALRRYVDRRAKHAGMVQDASLQNKTFYHYPDGPQQEARDALLRRGFDGESDVSYHWLWSGSPLDDPDLGAFDYRFAR